MWSPRLGCDNEIFIQLDVAGGKWIIVRARKIDDGILLNILSVWLLKFLVANGFGGITFCDRRNIFKLFLREILVEIIDRCNLSALMSWNFFLLTLTFRESSKEIEKHFQETRWLTRKRFLIFSSTSRAAALEKSKKRKIVLFLIRDDERLFPSSFIPFSSSKRETSQSWA